MMEQSKLHRVFEGILSSQSFELLKNFSTDDSWVTLAPDEKELLAQLFLLSAEATSQSGETEEARQQSIEAYQTACRLCPNSARSWYRLGAYLALGEHEEDLNGAVDALARAIELDGGFFDAHYALGSANLRLGALKSQEAFLHAANASFSQANALVAEGELAPAPAEFYWHWGIVWFLLSRGSGEPVDVKRTIDLYETAHGKGLSRPDFLNDYANAVVEFALLTSNDALIHDAIALYSAAIDGSDAAHASHQEKAIRLFNIGCCFQHLFDLSHDQHYFEKAEHSFSRAASLGPTLASVWQRWGYLLFYAARLRSDLALANEAVIKFQTAEEKGVRHPVAFGQCAQALLWIGREQDRLDLLKAAVGYAHKAIETKTAQGTTHPEGWTAMALCQYEYGYYFHDRRYFAEALSILQKGLSDHPKSALLWHTLALVKYAESEATGSDKLLQESLVCFEFASRSSYAALPSFWNDWGIAFLTLADSSSDVTAAQEAITRFETALELSKDAAAPWTYNLAKSFDILGDLTDDEVCYERAIQLLSDLLTRDPSCIQALSQLALSHLHLALLDDEEDNFSTAIALLEQYLETESEDDLAWGDLALALIHKGAKAREHDEIPAEWFRAEEVLMKAMSLGNDAAHYLGACLYAGMGDVAQACQFLEQALEKGALPPLSAIKEDEWLTPLASTVAFNTFLTKVEEREKTQPASGDCS